MSHRARAFGSAPASALQRVVAHCLEKRPEQRFQSAQDIAFALDAVSGTSDSRALADSALPETPTASRAGIRRWQTATVAAALIAVAAVPLAIIHWRERPPAVSPIRFSMPAPPKTSMSASGFGALPSLEVSPDGRHVVFRAASEAAVFGLWVRPLDSLTARLLDGTENVQTYFWSPDSRLIAFTANGALRSVPVSGGVSQTIAKLPPAIEAAAPVGGSWSRSGTILLGGNAGAGGTIWRVDAQGAVNSVKSRGRRR